MMAKKEEKFSHMLSIGIIGIGQIGGTLAYGLLQKGWGKVFLYDVHPNVAYGKAKDLYQASVIGQFPSCHIQVVASCQELSSCDVIVITAGKARQAGMDRKDLLSINETIMTSVARDLEQSSAIVIVVTNPVDHMSLVCQQMMNAPRHRVIGMSGVLDSGRFCSALTQMLNISDVQACVIGPHNDDMVPIASSIHLSGLSVPSHLLSSDIVQESIKKAKTGGAEIVNLLGNGSAFYAPVEALLHMIKAIIFDRHCLVPCSVKLEGEYGIKGIFCGVPVILGRKGVELIPEIPLSDKDLAAFQKSVSSLYSSSVT